MLDSDSDSPVPNDKEDEELEGEPFFTAGVRKGKRNPIHHYFTYNKQSNKSKCDTVLCGVELSGKNTTNLINHLKKSTHKKDYLKYLKDVSDKKETPSEKAKKQNLSKNEKHKQVTLDQVIMLYFSKYRWNASNSCNCICGIQIALKRKYYSNKCKQQIILRKKLAFYAATSSFPTSQCENQDFNNYIHNLDPRHRLPCRQRLTKDIVELAKKGRLLIKKRIHAALTKQMATADIWSKKGLSSSYLGII